MTTTTERAFPQDVQAERSLVALLCEDWQEDAAHIVPGHCYDPLTRAVVKCARALHARSVPVNLETLNDELRERDLLGDGKPVGSISDVSACANHLAMNETGATLAARIYTVWERRRAIRAATVLVDAAYNDNPATWPSSRARVVRALAAGEALPGSAPTQWQPNVQSMRALMDKQLPAVKWSVRELFPEGVTLLAAKAKRGKSTLMLHVGASVAGGTRALGHFETEQSDVLYLALEDNERRLKKRLSQMMRAEDVPPGLDVEYRWPPLDMGGLEALDTYLEEHPTTGMVIIDTLEHVRAKRRIANGLYGDDYSAVRGLQQLAGKRQVAIVAITHLRKSPAEDPFDEINASMGLLSGVDNAVVMRPANGIMELHRRGRDYEDDTVLALKGDAKTLLWSVAGEAEEVTRSAERKKIIAALTAVVPDTMSSKEIATVIKAEYGNVRFLLTKMFKDGEVIRPEHGQYTIPTNIAPSDGKKLGGKQDKPIVSDVSAPKKTANIPQSGVAPHWDRADARDVSDVSDVSGVVSNGRYHPAWEPRYLELRKQGMPEREATYQAMHENESEESAT